MFNELKSRSLPDGSTVARRVPGGNSREIKYLLLILSIVMLFTDYWVIGLMLMALATIISRDHYECGACGHAVSSRSQVCRICRAHLMRRIPASLDLRPWFARPLFLNLVVLCLTLSVICLVLWFKQKK